MFTPLTENVSLAQQAEFVKLLGKESADIAQMQANTYSELGRWMLDNNLMEYYSEPMIKDLREAAGATGSSPTPPASSR